MKFNQSIYHVNENGGTVQPTLVLSNPTSYNITIEVVAANRTASGELSVVTNELLHLCLLTCDVIRWRHRL